MAYQSATASQLTGHDDLSTESSKKEDSVVPVAVENEQSLIARAQQRDHTAFTKLLEIYDRRVMNLILRFTGDKFERDDLYQDIFTACYVALPKFSGKSSFYTWLYRVAINRCISHVRRKRPLEEEREFPVAGPDWERRQQLQTVLAALEKLSGPQRISFHLFYIEQWSLKEIAGILECREGSVKSHLDRARKRIRLDKEVAQWLTSS